jgi:trk system potassium uptake protein TrkA
MADAAGTGLVAIIGCTSLGASLASRLSASGHDVCVITDTESALARLDRDFQGFTYVVDDMTNADALERCSVNDAVCVFALTLSDNENVLVAHLARRIWGVQSVVARLSDPDNASLLEDFDIDVLCPNELCERELARLTGLTLGGDD